MTETEWTQPLPPIYFCHNDIHYKQVVIDITEKPDKFQLVPIDFDTTRYGFYQGKNNVVHRIHDNSDKSSFYAPYIRYENKMAFAEVVCSFIERFAADSLLKEIVLYTYRYIDSYGERHFALAAQNLKKKDKIIHENKIRTTCLEVGEDRPNESWFLIATEMGEYKEDTCLCKIEKTIVLPWENPPEETYKRAPFTRVCRLALCNPSSGFRAVDCMYGISGAASVNRKVEKIPFQNQEKIDESIRWLVQVAREYNGYPAIEVSVEYMEHNDRIDASITASGMQAQIPHNDEDDEF